MRNVKTLSEWMQEQEQLCAKATSGPWEASRHSSVATPNDWEIKKHQFPGPPYEGDFEDEWGLYPPLGESGPVALIAGEPNARFFEGARLSLPIALKVIRAIFANHGTGKSTRELFEIAEKVINGKTREWGP